MNCLRLYLLERALQRAQTKYAEYQRHCPLGFWNDRVALALLNSVYRAARTYSNALKGN